MRLEAIIDILLSREILRQYKSPLFNKTSRLFNEVFTDLYGEYGRCSDLTINDKQIQLPFKKMGKLDSTMLFGIDELTLFALYWLLRDNVKCALDIGANVGLHSVVMGYMGFNVFSFEPDPDTFVDLSNNLNRNGLTTKVTASNAAMSDVSGTVNFTRVCDNTMSSHIAGSKSSPYGQLEHLEISCVEARHFFGKAELIKLDAESHEFPILVNGLSNSSNRPEILMEVGDDTNSSLLYDFLHGHGYTLFAQRNGWQEVTSHEQIPKSHRQGSLLCSTGLLSDILAKY